MEENQNNEATEGKSERSIAARDGYVRYLSVGGYLFLSIGAIMFILMVYFIMTDQEVIKIPESSSNIEVFKWIVAEYGSAILILAAAFFSSVFGKSMLRAAGIGSVEIIPRKDMELLSPLIQNSDEKAITQYVRLSSLGGFTGTFTKLGFTGLPLATSILTLIFSLFSFFNPVFLDLAKLTLGAFIGSFVQRQVRGGDQERQPNENVNL